MQSNSRLTCVVFVDVRVCSTLQVIADVFSQDDTLVYGAENGMITMLRISDNTELRTWKPSESR